MNRIDYAVKVVNILKGWDFDLFANHFEPLALEQSVVGLIEIERESNSSPMRAALCVYGFMYTAYTREKKRAIEKGNLTIH